MKNQVSKILSMLLFGRYWTSVYWRDYLLWRAKHPTFTFSAYLWQLTDWAYQDTCYAVLGDIDEERHGIQH